MNEGWAWLHSRVHPLGRATTELARKLMDVKPLPGPAGLIYYLRFNYREAKERMEQFKQLFDKILKSGATPVSMCECGRGCWMYEGTVQEAFKRHTEPCEKCGSTKKRLYGDFDAEL